MICNGTKNDPACEILVDGDFLYTEGKLCRMSICTIQGAEMEADDVDCAEIVRVELTHFPLEVGHAASATIVVPADRLLMMISEGTADVLPADVGMSRAAHAALIEGLVASWGMENTIPRRDPWARPGVENVFFRLRDMPAEVASPTRGSAEPHSDADRIGQDAGLEPA